MAAIVPGFLLVVVYLTSSMSPAQSCDCDKMQASIDLLNRQILESKVNSRVSLPFDEVKGQCASGVSPAVSLPLGPVSGQPAGVSGPARCALYCHDLDGCSGFNFLARPASDGSQCQLFTKMVGSCSASADNSCRFFKMQGKYSGCASGESSTAADSTQGFVYMAATKTYIKPVYESLTWAEAQKRCREINPASHLAVFKSQSMYQEVTSYLRKEPIASVNEASSRAGFPVDWNGWWTAARKMEDSPASYAECMNAPMVWAYDANKRNVVAFEGWEKPAIFLSGFPDCTQYWKISMNYEACMAIPPHHLYLMNDMMCDFKMAALCQIDVQNN